MHVWTRALLRRSTLALLALAVLSSAFAASLAVHPFRSDDPLLGVAMADEVAAAFRGSATVFGPDVAPGLVPPLVVVDGFINLGRVLDANEWTGPSGPSLLLSGAGVDVAVSGAVEQYDERSVLRLEVAYAGGTRRAELSAAPGDRARLVSQAVRLLTPLLDLATAPTPVASPALSGDYGAYVRGVALAASGLVADAAASGKAANDGTWPERGDALQEDLAAVLAGDLGVDEEQAGAEAQATSRLARRALLALSLPSLHETDALSAFAALAEGDELPVAAGWQGVLLADVGDYDAAAAAFEAARAGGYHYATALLASLEQTRGDVAGALELVDALVEQGAAAGSAPLMGASIVAFLVAEPAQQVASLQALARAAPFLAYPHQELSFLAFDRDDALAAAEALTVAVQLQPESSLYWTNLGWANYLLGFLEESEEASKRAMELDANQYIAAYNLGLVRAVTGRLEAALEAYDYAVALDPGVDDEVIVDLVNARSLYPGVSAVEYSLARLYEAKALRSEARLAYRRFLSLAASEGRDGESAAFVTAARERLVVLNAPPPPLEIFGEVGVSLGQRGPAASPFHPGDPLFPSFELSTPGDQLPTLVDVTVALRPLEGDGAALASASAAVEPPAGAVGYVVDFVPLELPLDLPAGDYLLVVDAASGVELSAHAEATISVVGEAVPLRQLFGRNVVMTGLEVEAPMYGRADIASPERVVESMVQELHDAAAAAEAALPVVEGGRFDGLNGSELFLAATAADVRDFLAYVASTDTSDTRFTFVDGYAQWALDGAPVTD